MTDHEYLERAWKREEELSRIINRLTFLVLLESALLIAWSLWGLFGG